MTGCFEECSVFTQNKMGHSFFSIILDITESKFSCFIKFPDNIEGKGLS